MYAAKNGGYLWGLLQIIIIVYKQGERIPDS